MFPAHVISRRGNTDWPARSFDLHACDSFIWGYLKSRVYVKQPRTIQDLKENLRDKMAAISPIMLQRVMHNFQKQLWECVDTNRRYLKDTVFKNWRLKFKCFEMRINLIINSNRNIIYFLFYFNLKRSEPCIYWHFTVDMTFHLMFT